jgi:hypothetical protein
MTPRDFGPPTHAPRALRRAGAAGPPGGLRVWQRALRPGQRGRLPLPRLSIPPIRPTAR